MIISINQPTAEPETLPVSIHGNCNHDGATLEEIDELEFDTGPKEYAPTGTKEVLICKCEMWFIPTDDGGEWV